MQQDFNTFSTNRLVHPYHLDESISAGCFHFRAFSIEISVSKQCKPDLMPPDAASELGQHSGLYPGLLGRGLFCKNWERNRTYGNKNCRSKLQNL